MLTIEQVQEIGLGLKQTDEQTCLLVESGLQWLLNNTTLKFNMNNITELKALPANVRLFLSKFTEIYGLRYGVTSESISGLSQSFADANSLNNLLWQLADEILGDLLKSKVKFVSAASRWQ